jgi:hypothetical protein
MQFKDLLTTIILVNLVGYIAIPYTYIRLLSYQGEVNVYFLNEFQDRFKQVKSGISLAASAFALVLGSYFFLYEF